MNRHGIIDSLYLVSRFEAKQHEGSRCANEQLDLAVLRYPLRSLAWTIRGNAACNDILPAIFSAEAIAYLLEMPNHYSFWATVQRASIFQDIMGAPLPINLRAVQLAYARLDEELSRDPQSEACQRRCEPYGYGNRGGAVGDLVAASATNAMVPKGACTNSASKRVEG